MRTDTATFVVLLIGVIILVGALRPLFPAILLGPIVPGPHQDTSTDLTCTATFVTAFLSVIVFTILLGLRATRCW